MRGEDLRIWPIRLFRRRDLSSPKRSIIVWGILILSFMALPSFPSMQGPPKAHAADWALVNEPGYRSPSNDDICAMILFDSRIFAGTNNGSGCQVWRYDGGTSWSKVSQDGFGNTNNKMVSAFCALDGSLFAGTYNSG